MPFEYDPAKSATNKAKHGITFQSKAMDTCLKSVNVNMEIVIIRKNKTVLDAEISWSKVDGHSLLSSRVEFNLNPN